MSTVSTWLWLGLLVLFVLVNGLFVAAEYSLIRLRKSRVEEMMQQKVRGARTIHQLQTNMDRTVAGAQLGITIMGLVVGGVGGEPIKALLESGIALLAELVPPLQAVQVPAIVAVIFSFVLLTILHVIVGEQVPKMFALRAPERVALTLSMPFAMFCKLTAPFLWLIGGITALVMKLPGMPGDKNSGDSPPSVDELLILVETSARAGTLGTAESGLVQRALEYRGLKVQDVMVPISHMDCLSEDVTILEALDFITRTKHSRLPLYRGSRHNVTSILRTRELLDVLRKRLKAEARVLQGGPKPSAPAVGALETIGSLSAYLRKPFYVPADTTAAALLEELKKRHLQLAIITGSEGEAVGLVTQEDLVEQLVGEIHDEDDGPIDGVELLADGVYKVEGPLTLYEFRRVFDARLTSTRGGTTVQEVFVENHSGTVEVGSQIEINGFSFKVLQIKPGTAQVEIEWLEVRLLPDTEDGAAGGRTTS